MNILSSALLSLLPKRYRALFTAYAIPCEGALVSGIFQSVVSLGLLFRGYYAYINARMAQLPTEALLKAGEKNGESAIMLVGPLLVLEYILHFTTIILLFMVIEGAVRAIAAVGARETLPDLPLFLLAKLHSRIDAESHERSLGARLRDEVQIDPAGVSLQIKSCRPKQWNQLTTVSHDGQFYELVSEQKAQAPRPFVYLLRKKLPTAVIRGIYAYDPDEALQTKSRRIFPCRPVRRSLAPQQRSNLQSKI